MLIQPVQPVDVTIKIGKRKVICQLVSLTDQEIELSCSEYMDKDSVVSFLAQYFRGSATIIEIQFMNVFFKYKLSITEIQFQPGLLINTRL